jgi:translation elongation factor EF-1alpha
MRLFSRKEKVGKKGDEVIQDAAMASNETTASSPITPSTQNRKATLFVQDVYTITGFGVVPCGIVEDGKIQVGMKLNINGTIMTVKTIEKSKDSVQEAEKGDSIGFTVEGVSFELAKSLLGSANKSRIVFSDDGSFVNQLKLLSWGKGEKWVLKQSPDGKNEPQHL